MEAAAAPVLGLRERKKLEARAALAEAALALSLEHGFEKVTVEAIAARAGVSRRSFFRYFPTKESAIFPQNDARRAQFERLIATEARSSGGLAAVRHACLELARDYTQNRRAMLAQHRLVESSPTLLAYERTLDREWEASIARGLAAGPPRKRASTEATIDRRTRFLAAAVLGVIRGGLAEWYASECRLDLVTLGKEAFDLLERGFGSPARAPVARRRPPRARRRASPRVR